VSDVDASGPESQIQQRKKHNLQLYMSRSQYNQPDKRIITAAKRQTNTLSVSSERTHRRSQDSLICTPLTIT